jgi:alkylation response protein AidB-like acyl-CoA dehydrogenase
MSMLDLPECAFAGPGFSDLLVDLADGVADMESSPAGWPGSQFQQLAKAGVLGWVIPVEYGGNAISGLDLTHGYLAISSACLTTAFVLTQRNGACQRIASSVNVSLKQELLPDLCTGKTFATVGISHLTTSRQHLARPAVRVEMKGETAMFSGTIPWVTGADHAKFIVTGGTCADGKQVLAVIETSLKGVTVNEPPLLLSMNASRTGSVDLQDVVVEKSRIIAGPVEHVMKQGIGGKTGSLTTSALAAGTTAGVLQRLAKETENRPDLEEILHPLQSEWSSLSKDILQSDEVTVTSGETPETIRRRANSLVLRAAQAYLGATKGAGFVQGHPAERAVREAMFFLVWSCPQPVLTAALREFACIG